MSRQILLKNSSKTATIDKSVYNELMQDAHLKTILFFDNLRLHSSGCVVFQKSYKKNVGDGYRTETIYLHKLIAERFLAHTRHEGAKLVGCKNGSKRDCRLDNLEFRSRAVSSRKRKTSSKVGYTGVYKENNRYRAVISQNRRSVHIGMFTTAEEAAKAYNAKSLELYGEAGKINVVPPHASSDSHTEIGQSGAKTAPAPQAIKELKRGAKSIWTSDIDTDLDRRG